MQLVSPPPRATPSQSPILEKNFQKGFLENRTIISKGNPEESKGLACFDFAISDLHTTFFYEAFDFFFCTGGLFSIKLPQTIQTSFDELNVHM